MAAGSTVELQWTPWPESHKGPVIDYLASCNGECETVDKTALKFFKIDEEGLIDGSSSPGNWASDKLIANNNTWVSTIPSDIAPGNYVLRHEIIALHSAYDANGAQNYPQCINLIVTGSGTASPAGVAGTELYTSTDAGILIDIYKTLDSYVIPGPALYSSGATPSSVESSAATAAPSSTAAQSSAAQSTAAPSTVAPTASTSAPFPFSNSTIPAIQTTTAASPVVTSDYVDVPEPTTTSVPVVVAPVDDGSDDTAVTTVIATVSPVPVTPSACDAAATVTVTSAGATVTVAAPTVTVTATVTASAKPLPSGATFDDVLSWFSSGVKKAAGGKTRRHARAVRL